MTAGVLVLRSGTTAPPHVEPVASTTMAPAPASPASATPATVEVESLPQASATNPEPSTIPARPQAGQAASGRPHRVPPSCNPPYTVDENGFRKYKRECATW